MLLLYDLRSPFFNSLQMLLDNTGDDPDRHAAVFINVRHGKRNIVFLVAHEKSSLAPQGKPIAFELSEENGFVWKGHYDISIDDLANGISREKKSEQAENLIRDCLSSGKYPQQIILKKAQNTGISKRVLDEAKKSLGVISLKDGRQWYWKLPEEKEASNF